MLLAKRSQACYSLKGVYTNVGALFLEYLYKEIQGTHKRMTIERVETLLCRGIPKLEYLNTANI